MARGANKATRQRHQRWLRRQAIKQDMKCCYCTCEMVFWRHRDQGKKPGNMATRDHVVPYSLGGPNLMTNYLICCSNCNGERGDLPADLFAIHKARQRIGETDE